MIVEKNDIPKLYGLCERLAGLSTHIDFDKPVFTDWWGRLIDAELGCIFALPDYKGMLAAIKMPIQHTGIMAAFEQFWVVDDSAKIRGIKLFKEFEQWAIDNKCKQIIVNHMVDLPIGKLYERLGYKLHEIHYMKEVT